ncbi:hypothetical protein GJV85_10625 [Sulfurimonas aquatica]|uniref:Uncharacterized protein n=1 Tax=Sulfurimonas aquatica TaxID=2672570 RepID=A0A975B1K3_9BACT|nr:hypothetical protein [Sulfurimonas aquatica]QSZ42541.1 hypothetical protein GJV85_10625 [Sulfurimonas aquatica]
MAIYNSDGKKLINVEYDVVPKVNDTIDGMRVISINSKNNDEYVVFLLESNTRVTCYIFDEIFIIGKSSSFDSLNEAVEAWNNDEI